MGNNGSTAVAGSADAQGAHRESRLSTKDVERLHRRFARLADAQGTVEISQFQQMVELGGNPFIGRILQLFDSNKDGKLTAQEFGAAMEYFGKLSPVEEQYKFAFNLYDVDGDGVISGPELQTTLGMLAGKAYTPAQLEQVVLHTLKEYDRDGDNGLNLEEFKLLLSAGDVQSMLGLGR